MLIDISLKLPWATKESKGLTTLEPVAVIEEYGLQD